MGNVIIMVSGYLARAAPTGAKRISRNQERSDAISAPIKGVTWAIRIRANQEIATKKTHHNRPTPAIGHHCQTGKSNKIISDMGDGKGPGKGGRVN